MESAPSDYLVLDNARIFTGAGPVIHQGHLILRGGLIEAVAEGPAPTPGLASARWLDAGGRWVLPGLIDAHCHLCWDRQVPHRRGEPLVPFLAGAIGVESARKKLMAGVTTVRDVGAAAGVNLLLKRAVEEGLVPGPRILAAGEFITSPTGHCHYWSRNVEDAGDTASAAAEQVAAGADLVKLMVSGGVASPTEDPGKLDLRPEWVAAAVAVAREAGVPVVAHAHPAAAIRVALEAGCDTIEHGTFLEPDLVDLMLERDVAVVPTLCVYDRMRRNVDRFGEDLAALVQRVWEAKLPRLRAAFQAGVRLGVGTDSCTFFPHDDLATELGLLVHGVGLTPKQALTAATRGNAEILGVAGRVGTLEPGKAADLILVEGEPLENVEDVRRVHRVVARGAMG